MTSAEVGDSAALAGSMPRLAAEVLATYEDADRARFLDNLFRLQILTGRYPEAEASLAELRSLRRDPPPQTRARYVQYEIFVRARSLAASSGRPFAEAFRDRFAELDDRAAALAARAILPEAYRFAASALLPGGDVVVVGGYSDSNENTDGVWRFRGL